MPRKTSEIERRARAGQPLDHIPVIDFHTHLARASEWYVVPRGETADVLACMDRFGVDHWITFPIAVASDCASGNRYVYDETAAHRDRFTPLVMLHAAFPQDWEELLYEGHARGARGIKLISAYQGRREADVDWTPALAFARDKGWVALNHSWDRARLPDYARAFPEVVFIMGHTFTAAAQREIVTAHDNVFLCTCAHFACELAVNTEELIRLVPPEKIVMGSDAVDLDTGTAIGPIAYADIPEAAKEAILGGTALAIADRLGWDLRARVEQRLKD